MINNRSMPPALIIPELPYPDVRQAADWLCQTFGSKHACGSEITAPSFPLEKGR